MKSELAKELYAELRAFVQQEVAKNTDALDAKRKAPKTTDDMDMPTTAHLPIAASSTTGASGVTFHRPRQRLQDAHLAAAAPLLRDPVPTTTST